MFKNLFITCDEATLICNKSQYNEASFFDKFKLNLHFLICKICRLYNKQNSIMTGLFSMKASDCKKEKKCLSQREKEALKEKLEKFKE